MLTKYKVVLAKKKMVAVGARFQKILSPVS
jgi:hypothetical protein